MKLNEGSAYSWNSVYPAQSGFVGLEVALQIAKTLFFFGKNGYTPFGVPNLNLLPLPSLGKHPRRGTAARVPPKAEFISGSQIGGVYALLLNHAAQKPLSRQTAVKQLGGSSLFDPAEGGTDDPPGNQVCAKR